MRINQDNIINNSPDASFLLVNEGSFSELAEGDIITGVITKNGSSPMIRFDEISKEIPADPDNYRYSPIGEKHAFRVEKKDNRISLKDLGAVKDQTVPSNIPAMDPRDSSLLRLTHDFRDTMNDIESDETKAASDMTEEDAVKIIDEGFDLEDFKAERLMRALERIHAGRAEKAEDIDDQVKSLREEKLTVKKQSARAAANKYDNARRMADRLFSDAPSEVLSGVNVYSPTSDITLRGPEVLTGAPSAGTDNYAYTSRVSYTSPEPVASGIAPSVPEIDTANPESTVLSGSTVTDSLVSNTSPNPVLSGAAPIVPENNTVQNDPVFSPKSNKAQESGFRQQYNGTTPEDTAGITDFTTVSDFLSPRETTAWRELTFRISIEEARIRMTGFAGKAADSLGTKLDSSSAEMTIARLREQLRSLMEKLSREWDIDTESSVSFSHREISEIATDTLISAADIANAPASFYRTAVTVGTSITFASLEKIATDEQASVTRSTVTMSVIASYDAGATEIRADLGDSIKKAFDHIDEVLTENNLPVTDANKRAVRILASAGMDVTEQSIENVKYYDAKVMDVVDRMTPATVLSLIKRGINPLNESIDSLGDLLDEAPEKSPLSREEQISTFLVRLDEKGDISEAERSAYINIYRLLYTISRDDYAAIASVLAGGGEMTLKNLLAAQRSRKDSGMDIKIDDTTSVVHSDFVNSISANLEAAFAYNKRLTNEIISEDDPDVTDRALADTVPDDRYEELTLEEVAHRMRQAKEEGSTDPARARELVRFCMSTSPEYRRFLKKLGLKDSAKNTMTLIEGLGSDSLGIPAGDPGTLTSAMESKETLDAYASELLGMAEEETKNAIFPGNTTVVSERPDLESPTGVLSALSRYDLLRDLTKKEHYRFALDNGSGSSINLTFIHDKANAGTVSIHIADEMLVTTASLTVRNTAEGTVETRAVIYGSITCESIEETRGAETRLKVYKDRMESRGIDASGITVRSGGLGIMQQLSNLTGLFPADYSPPAQSERTSSGTLYEAAKTFVEIWTTPI